MTKWEYLDEESYAGDYGPAELSLDKLNVLGREGWEIVAVSYVGDNSGWPVMCRVLLKRPVAES